MDHLNQRVDASGLTGVGQVIARGVSKLQAWASQPEQTRRAAPNKQAALLLRLRLATTTVITARGNNGSSSTPAAAAPASGVVRNRGGRHYSAPPAAAASSTGGRARLLILVVDIALARSRGLLAWGFSARHGGPCALNFCTPPPCLAFGLNDSPPRSISIPPPRYHTTG